MHINYVKYKDYVKEISNTFAPLNYLLKTFSLNFEEKNYKNSYIVIIKKVIPAAILGCLNLITLYYKFMYFNILLTISVRYAETVQIIYDTFQYTVDLIFVFKYGGEMYYEFMKQFAYIDGLLGTNYFSIIRHRLIKNMIILIFMWVSSSLADYVVWANGIGIIPSTTYALAYVYVFIKILTNLDLIVNVMRVEIRLRALGDTILDCCTPAEKCPGNIKDFLFKANQFCYDELKPTDNPKLRPINVISCINREGVKWLCRCYLVLVEQATFVNKMFGIRILLNSLSMLIDMVRFTNLAVLVIIGSQSTGYNHGYYAAAAALWRTLSCVSVAVSLVYHCEQVYRQRERIISLLDHLIFDKNLDDNLLSAFSEFRGLVQSRTINFHMGHFIRLEYPLLVSISSVVVTYTIILLQSVNNN